MNRLSKGNLLKGFRKVSLLLVAFASIPGFAGTNLPSDDSVLDACESSYLALCSSEFEPAMCIFPGNDKWFAASNRCKAELDLKLWACQQGLDADQLDITCYLAVLDQ